MSVIAEPPDGGGTGWRDQGFERVPDMWRALVLAACGAGMSNNEIAQKLFISPKTASVHVSRILIRLAVNSRVKATAIAHEERLLTNGN